MQLQAPLALGVTFVEPPLLEEEEEEEEEEQQALGPWRQL